MKHVYGLKEDIGVTVGKDMLTWFGDLERSNESRLTIPKSLNIQSRVIHSPLGGSVKGEDRKHSSRYSFYSPLQIKRNTGAVEFTKTDYPPAHPAACLIKTNYLIGRPGFVCLKTSERETETEEREREREREN
ncbi:hypothetical protein EVAR_25985_1 [Eumeta japonica]|uniref:Uncharacterized protein n=1 Tax=Eumeta variegata TaxID=151549 RepID=A0A4C1V3G7_EUMVA|nr:hypothetical protein EVAR_25985_1 [Eumeta japonica]